MKLNLAVYRDKRICVAVSGGGDSVALLHYFHAHASEYGITLSAVNCEHGIRGETSLSDSAFVKELCEQWNVPLFFFSADCPALAALRKTSVETAAREFRYEKFEKLLREKKTDIIATAHHQGDNAETVLFNLCRGASLTGAGGISERKGFIRPLLNVSREEIVAYLRKNGLSYKHDETNDDEKITRNAIRLRVLPVLEEIIPSATAGIVRFSSLARADDELLYELAGSLITRFNGGIKVRFCDKKPLFSRACLIALKEAGVEKDYTAAHLDALYALQQANNGEKACMPAGITGIREYDGITFYRAKKRSEEELPFALGTFCLAGTSFSVTLCEKREEGKRGKYVDLLKIPSSAVFRTRREGDVFTPFGGGKKKLKEYLIDKKIPQRERDELVLLAYGKEILAIVGVEISDCLKTGETSAIAQILTKDKNEKE